MSFCHEKVSLPTPASRGEVGASSTDVDPNVAMNAATDSTVEVWGVIAGVSVKSDIWGVKAEAWGETIGLSWVPFFDGFFEASGFGITNFEAFREEFL